MRILLILLVAGIAAWAQAGVPDQSRGNSDSAGQIQGTVSDRISGAPIRDADLVLLRDEPSDSDDQSRPLGARTDAAGHYSITQITAGRYRLRASHNRYIGATFGANRWGSPGTVLALNPGQHLSNVNIALVPAAVIRGRVVDENGEPLLRVRVVAMRYAHQGPVRMLVSSGQAQTDDRGEYRIFGLAPGSYYLRATYYGDPWANAVMTNDNLAYLPVFYPGVLEPNQASTIEAEAGAEIPADFTLTRMPTVRVTGTIVNPDANPQHYGIVLIAPGLGAIPTRVEEHAGRFEIEGVAPGTYVLQVQAYKDPGAGMAGEESAAGSARQTITVGSAPVQDVKIALSPPIQIRGKVRGDGSAHVDVSQLMISLEEVNPIDPDMVWGIPGDGQVARDGSFEIKDVIPGKYRVEVIARTRGLENCYTKAIYYGGHDITDSTLNVKGGSAAPLELVISPAGATIQGLVKDANDHPVSKAVIVTVPQGKHHGRVELYQTAAADQRGFFRIRGMAPGEYKVFAWAEVEPDAWFDPDFMKKYEELGTSISVVEQERTNISMRVIPASTK